MRRAQGRRAASIGTLLPQVLQELGTAARPTRETVEEIWERVAGKEAARHSRPVGIRRGRVTVEVENSGWMHDLRMKRDRLVEGLVEMLGANRVSGLTFRIGDSDRTDA